MYTDVDNVLLFSEVLVVGGVIIFHQIPEISAEQFYNMQCLLEKLQVLRSYLRFSFKSDLLEA